jgi:ketosteroid isomerase-like protein
MDATSLEALHTRLRALEQEWMDAVSRRDIAYLEALLGEEFTLTTGRPGAEVRSREEYLCITRDRYTVRAFRFEEIEVSVYGDTATAAVVHSRYRQEGSMDGADRTSAFRMLDVFVWRDGRWQAVARHAIAILGV